jgi:hypothetical protein
VPLNTNALVTVEAAKAFIQPGGMGAVDDRPFVEVINRASSLIERWCGRPFAKATYTDLRLRGPCSQELFLRHTPIAASQPISVTLNGTALTVWRTEADGDPATKDVMLTSSCDDPDFTPDVLWRSYSWDVNSSYTAVPSIVSIPANVLVTYTGGFVLTPTSGYPTIPSDLEEAALEVVKKMWTDQSTGLQDATSFGIHGGGSDVSMTGTFGQGSALGYGPIPTRAFHILQSYRRLVVA